MQCNCCKKETSNVPEPCVHVTKGFLGEKRSVHYTVTKTGYRIDTTNPIKMIPTCDSCFLRVKNKEIETLSSFKIIGTVLAAIGVLFGLVWLFFGGIDVGTETVSFICSIAIILFTFVPGIVFFTIGFTRLKPMKVLSDNEKITQSKNNLRVVQDKDYSDIYIPVCIAKNVKYPGDLNTKYKLPVNVAEMVMQVANRY